MGLTLLQVKWRLQRLAKTQPLLAGVGCVVLVILMMMLVLPRESRVTSINNYRYKPQVDWEPRNRPMDHILHRDLNLQADDHVLVLTPMAVFRQEYWANLVGLSYPKDKMDLGFIIPRTLEGDQTLRELESVFHTPEAAKYHKITVLRQDQDSLMSQKESNRHAFQVQKLRRGLMAQARNSLLSTTLAPYVTKVLWLDSDIVESKPSLIEDLISINKPVLAANCFQRFFAEDRGKDSMRPYDFNNWAESEEGLRLASTLPDDEVIFEGYAEMATYRALMGHFYVPHSKWDTVVPLDGVGGTCLLVDAQVHRDGANFPPYPFKHLIETEGFAMMAKRLGYGVYGLPNYLVFHVNE